MSTDLGDLGGLATAIGLLDSNGDPRGDWFAKPEMYLKKILSDEGQRGALLESVDELLGGSDSTTDADGRTWVPLFEEGPIAVSVVVAEAEASAAVHVGVGLRVTKQSETDTIGVEGDLYVPLFAAAADNPLLLGSAAGLVDLTLTITLPDAAVSGGLELDSAGISARIPTGGGQEPTIGLTLRGLRMPGAATGRDIVVAADEIAELDDALLELIMGLVQASADTLDASDPAHGLAGLLGLVQDDGVPDFPVADVIADGASALAAWLASCVEGPARGAWLAHLATLLGGSVTGTGPAAAVTVLLNGGALSIDPVTRPGAGGLPTVTPRLTVAVAGGPGTSLRLDLEPVTLDLGTGSAIALPSLAILAQVAAEEGGALLGPDPGPGGLEVTVGSFEGGFALDADRRPLLVLRARDAVVGATSYPTLDLTDGDALAGAAGQVVADAAAGLLAALGPLGTSVGILVGLSDPAAGAAPRIDPTRLLADPLGALRDRWSALLDSDPAIVRSVLATWQSATAAAELRNRTIAGDGTPAAPYQIAVADGVDLLLTADRTRVSVALAARAAAPLALGANIEADVRVEVLRVDLSDAAPAAQFATGLIAVVALSAQDGDALRLTTDGYGLSLLSIGARLVWDPIAGVRVDPWLEAPELIIAGAQRPLPGIGVGGDAARAFPPRMPDAPDGWPDAVWEAVESVSAALLATAARERADDALATLLDAAVQLTGWGPGSSDARLSLARLAADPADELERWLGLLVGAGGSDPRSAEMVVGLLARLLEAPTTGTGVSQRPWAVALPGAAVPSPADSPGTGLGFGLDAPALLLTLGDASVDRFGSPAPPALTGWRPGLPGLSSSMLAAALSADADLDDVLGDALAGRASLTEGFEALLQRWAGTDGVVALPEALAPAGLTVHRPAELVHATRLDAPRVAEALDAVWADRGARPTRIVLVGVVAEGEPELLPPAGAEGIAGEIDLTEPGAPVEAFPAPAPAPAGTTVIRLGGRTSVDDASFDAQVARLRSALPGLAADQTITVVAGGAAGRIAVAAADGVAGIDAVVTVGTPWTPLTLDDVDQGPAAEGLRLLRTLMAIADADLAAEPEDAPATDGELPREDDADLSLARGLVESLLARDGRGDPLNELSAPERPLPDGFAVHAIVGSCSEEAVRRAITATVAAGLAGRSRRRVAEAADADRAAVGVHIPRTLGTAAGGLRAAVTIDAELMRWQSDGPRGPRLRIRLRVGGDRRWLVGGPDGARVPGPRPLALRALTLELTVALPAWGAGARAAVAPGRLVLHDAAAFGMRRARWVVDLSGPEPLVPEIRALLGEVAAQLAQAGATGSPTADTAIAGLTDALRALGLIDPSGGFDAVTLAGLLDDPAAIFDTVRGDAASTRELASGLRRAIGDERPDAGTSVRLQSGAVTATLDLATGDAAVSALTDLAATDAQVAFDVSIGARAVEIGARIGNHGLSAAGPPAGALRVSCLVPSGEPPSLTAQGTLRDPRGVRTVTLWPATTTTANELLALAPDVIGATALKAALTVLRATLAQLEPAAGAEPAELVDVLLRAVGLLRAGASDDATATVAWPAGLISDPRAWLGATVGDLPVAVPALVDAAAGLLPASGGPRPPGTLPLAPGVALRTTAAAGALEVLLDVDAAAFGGTTSDLVLRLAAGLRVDAAGVQPRVAVDLGATGVGAVRVQVDAEAGGSDPAIGVTVAVVPGTRPAIVIHPAARGLSGLADAAAAGAIIALPALLTRLAAEDPVGDAAAETPQAVAGRIVGRTGTALGLATGTPAVFSGAALGAFAADPAAAFAARAADISTVGLGLVVEAIDATLGASATRSVTSADGRVEISLGPSEQRIFVGWTPGTSTLDAAVALAGLPGVGAVAGALSVSPAGVDLVDVTVGPAPIDLGAVVLTPSARVAAGLSMSSPLVELGLGASGTARLLARFDGTGATLYSASGAPGAVTESQAPEDVAAAIVGAVLDVAGGVVLASDAVQDALQTTVLTSSVGAMLEGVVLTNARQLDPTLSADLTEPLELLRRLALGLANLGSAMDGTLSIDDTLDVGIASSDGTLGLSLGLTGGEWIVNPGSDVLVSLVTDASWIDPEVSPGLSLIAVRLPVGGGIEFAPGVEIGGLGVRISRSSGPLLDAGLTLDSVSVLGYGLVVEDSPGDGVRLGGGARVELAGLGVPLGGAGAGDGSNPTAAGVMPSAGSGEDSPAPRFSPALAIQKHHEMPVAVSLSAGPGDGPWFLAIQREFGPIYLEQVGLAVGHDDGKLTTIGVLIDGKVTLFGLSAAVDDLSLTYIVSDEGPPDEGSPFATDRWKVDVAGFAITAEMGGLTLAGGLRKFTPGEGGSEYLGMLLARLGVYGITVYGGFGQVGPEGDQYTSLFLFGAVNGPIGGPPAFFLTGIGGGFGANRGLVIPDLSQFADYPLIKALTPAARAGDPFKELADAREWFPARRGEFWFAAGISFNSFALVDGVAVLAVSFGGGLEISLLGVARMALPRPDAALVSIELALGGKVSTSEGIVLIHAQLTDNSWIIAPQARLTGGFAFAAWFGGPNKGQFVLTLGGYHPDFHRDGYPEVPRLGLEWKIGDAITIIGGSYFALTSEALMAGMKVEVHAELGPAWAHVVFGADGIVYFDPFWLSVRIYASIDAGVTIDLWFAQITISIHISAELAVTGPPFHAIARFEIGPVGVTFEIGPSEAEPPPLSWPQFVAKYLEEAAPGRARALAAITGAGTVPPAGGIKQGGDASPDGQPDRPFRVVAEFTATVTSTVPLSRLTSAGATQTLHPTHTISVAPMGSDGTTEPHLTLSLRRRVTTATAGAGGPDPTQPDRIGALRVTPRRDGAFPIGAWGAPQDLTNPKVPAGDVLGATDNVRLEATAIIPTEGPAIPYRQVETGGRRILPLLATFDDAAAAARLAAAATLASSLRTAIDDVEVPGDDRLMIAGRLLTARGDRGTLTVGAWQAGLAAPVLVGSLGEGLGATPDPVTTESVAVVAAPGPEIRPPRVLALLSSAEHRAARPAGTSGAQNRAPASPPRTTVGAELLRKLLGEKHSLAPRVLAPSLADVAGRLDPAVPARLIRSPARARVAGGTMVSTGTVPPTSSGLPGAAAVAQRAAAPHTLASLQAHTTRLLGDRETLAGGQVLVVELPDADIDLRDSRPGLRCHDGHVRLVLLAAAGRVLADAVVGAGERAAIPAGTRTAIVVAAPAIPVAGDPWTVTGGWTAARPLPSVSDGLLVCAGAVVDVLGRVAHRGPDPARAAWVAPAELLGREPATATTLATGGDTVAAAVAIAVSGSGTEGLAIGLDGARQAGAPLVTADAAGTGVLVFGLHDVSTDPVTVTVAADPGAEPRALGGLVVAGGSPNAAGPAAAADWLAGAVAGTELAALVPPPSAPDANTSTISWEVPR